MQQSIKLVVDSNLLGIFSKKYSSKVESFTSIKKISDISILEKDGSFLSTNKNRISTT